MALKKDYATQDCALARALELVGERWTMLIVRDAFYGVRRYSDFLAHLDIPRAVLSARLTTLTTAGVLATHRYSTSPPRDEYLLTPRGQELWPALYALLTWGEIHASRPAPRRRLFLHRDCPGPAPARPAHDPPEPAGDREPGAPAPGRPEDCPNSPDSAGTSDGEGAPLTAHGGCARCGAALVPPREVEIRPGPGAGDPHSEGRTDPVTRALRRPHRLLDPLEIGG
ncbi:helix-turn-helix domain-containing protein [Streptomyces sp. AJS327]|uniref:winged helix-turn-helix transcriptional regulator n=1 Tax=Streptomyces sp. AJS327 TaxID=2545265 RepID=UPI002155195F|nr:helix-turn-helix domain-containing protein [Streptomyces sp. AJS327]